MADFKGRVALVQSFSATSQAELAAQLRMAGYRVVSFVPMNPSRKQRALMIADRLIFHEVRPVIEGHDEKARVSEEAMAEIFADRTVDIHAYDSLGAQLAGRRAELGQELIAGLAPAQWYDKRWMADRLMELGIPGPDVWDTPLSENFPVIVKARFTSGGGGVRICRSQREVEEAWQDLGGFHGNAFMQEFITGPTYSTSAVAREGELLAHETYTAIKAPGEPTGPSLKQVIVDRPDLVANVRELVREMGYSGILNLQQLEDADGRGRPIDFNPRVPGAFGALAAAGSALFPAYLALLERTAEPVGRTLEAGIITSAVRLSYTRPWADRAAFVDWHRRTDSQIWARRESHGYRFVAWGYLMKTRMAVQCLSAIRRNRSGEVSQRSSSSGHVGATYGGI